ncbi:MAG: YybH family protein [Gemmatimonadales bacterium]
MGTRGLVAALALTVAACGGSEPVDDPGAASEVEERFAQWVRAWNSFNPANLEPFYIQKRHLTVAWPNGERMRGWEEESEYQRNFLATVMVMNLQPRDATFVMIHGNLALITFGFSLDMAAGGRRQIGPGQATMLWQKEGGVWRIYSAQLSYARTTERQLTQPPTRR